ncbi:1,4-dihydroxy-2-naphthoate octaprenyltransferase [Zobellia sp. 1_MG-2023]|uniref:1,4-dihydroxy-2-naphthoate octaprenyltransferase n=1 Tax=Zobellia sp. 1_MG-2023 TaxID=3062626 RepID=UPI0026E3EF4E|nr:1,4-dihydroxy-2-naphthoate octaprenyltransferase [Zobellia sp. 1_MG-2023]MDO6820825.1 1,4-dihydroxy-2-naphthoate octaprenyltransferase [Zobellia sp. 1_MG-2023]
MGNINPWISAARLRTLPLSVSGIVVGTALANLYGFEDTIVFVLALLTTIGFQVTSNFANDYGDGVKGTDNDERIGPKRALQSGNISRQELKEGIIFSIIIDVILVVALVYFAFGFEDMLYPILFLILGAASIWAAIKYTVGASAYGYRGLGDLFVFLFFGLLAVMGSMVLYTKQLYAMSLLPAIAIGLLSAGVLNLNNLRDYESDKNANKNTLIVFIGFQKGKIYHYALLITAFLCILAFSVLNLKGALFFLPLIAFIPIFLHLKRVHATDRNDQIDPELKKLALSTFFLSVLIYISCNIFL